MHFLGLAASDRRFCRGWEVVTGRSVAGRCEACRPDCNTSPVDRRRCCQRACCPFLFSKTSVGLYAQSEAGQYKHAMHIRTFRKRCVTKRCSVRTRGKASSADVEGRSLVDQVHCAQRRITLDGSSDEVLSTRTRREDDWEGRPGCAVSLRGAWVSLVRLRTNGVEG